MRTADHIIVGQGLAGTILAHTLLQKGHSVILLNDPSLSRSSRVAAGLYNPIVFKKFNLSWKADRLIPFMDEFYPLMERTLKAKFYHKKSIIKIFVDENEKILWKKKQATEAKAFMSAEIHQNFLDDVLKENQGTAEVLQAGNLDVNTFLDASENYFRSIGILHTDKVDHSSIELFAGKVKYKGFETSQLTFCEGYPGTNNPFFSWLPFNPAKGEVLTIRIPGQKIPFEKVLNKGVFILPLGNDIYRVGATYSWDIIDEILTETARSEIIQKLEKIIKVPYEVLSQEAGVRPATHDRRPFIGKHHDHPQLAIFNGMGSKAVMLAPYFADQLAEHFRNGATLDPEADIRRCR
jgi:glycine/D-amino acid oxidase-like deaminating enzyme